MPEILAELKKIDIAILLACIFNVLKWMVGAAVVNKNVFIVATTHLEHGLVKPLYQ